MKKLIIVFATAALMAGCGSAAVAAAPSSSETSPNFRVQNGRLQYQDEDGNWMTVANQESLDSALSALQTEMSAAQSENSERNTVNTPSPSTKTIVIQGPKGEQGPAGQTGVAGAKGADGKDGANGTVVTIGADGELIINGSPTGYYLIKEQPSASSPAPMPTSFPTPTPELPPTPTPTPTSTPPYQMEYDITVRHENGFVVITWDDYQNYSTVTITGDAVRTYHTYLGQLSVSENTFTNGQTYTIHVDDSYGEGETSYTFRNDSVELAAVQNLKYQTGDDGSLTISWDPVDHAESYNVTISGWGRKRTVTTNTVTFPKVENGRYTAYVTASSSDPAYTLSQPSSIDIYQQSISGKIDLAKPQNIHGSYDSSSGSITLSWDPVDHADYYMVTVQEMDTGPTYIVDSPSISIKDLKYYPDGHFTISALANDSSKYASSSAIYQLENASATPEMPEPTEGTGSHYPAG